LAKLALARNEFASERVSMEQFRCDDQRVDWSVQVHRLGDDANALDEEQTTGLPLLPGAKPTDGLDGGIAAAGDDRRAGPPMTSFALLPAECAASPSPVESTD